MNVKRYIAKNAEEAIEKIRNDQGNESMILNSRPIRKKGIRGFFAQPMVEFVVASAGDDVVANSSTIKDDVAEVMDSKMKGLETQLGEMTKAIETFSFNVNNQGVDDDELGKFYDVLMRNDVKQELALKLYSRAKKLFISGITYKDSIVQVLGDCLGIPDGLVLNETGQTVVVLIGPTGVGKTTSLAKLAAIYSLQKNLKAAFITADVYRIGAVEQLKTYADIMGIPMEVIPNVSEVSAAMQKHADAEIIFIDTPGKSPTDDQHSADMQTLIELSNANNVFLTVSATSNVESLKKIFKTYENIEDYKLIVTKTDEASAESILLNISNISDAPISYLAFGQNVPNDIEPMNPEKLIQIVLQKMEDD